MIFFKRKKWNAGFTLIEVLIGVLIAGFLTLGMLQFSKKIVQVNRTTQTGSTQELELSRFQSLMQTDLARAGNDASGLSVLKSYHQVPTGVPCQQLNYEYGLVSWPSDSDCETIYGVIGILSYQGMDIDHNGIFYPEESIDFHSPKLRPYSGQSVTPNTYNDFIVYDWNIADGTIVRKNIGDPTTTDGDFSEVVLRNVVYFNVEFKEVTFSGTASKPGQNENNYSGVGITVSVHDTLPDPNYKNPELQSTSQYYHYKTSTRSFVFDVIDTAICVY